MSHMGVRKRRLKACDGEPPSGGVGRLHQRLWRAIWMPTGAANRWWVAVFVRRPTGHCDQLSTRSAPPTRAIPWVNRPAQPAISSVPPELFQCQPPAGSSTPGRTTNWPSIWVVKFRQRNDPRQHIAITTSPKATGSRSNPKLAPSPRRQQANGKPNNLGGFSVTASSRGRPMQQRPAIRPPCEAVSRGTTQTAKCRPLPRRSCAAEEVIRLPAPRHPQQHRALPPTTGQLPGAETAIHTGIAGDHTSMISTSLRHRRAAGPRGRVGDGAKSSVLAKNSVGALRRGLKHPAQSPRAGGSCAIGPYGALPSRNHPQHGDIKALSATILSSARNVWPNLGVASGIVSFAR